MKEGCELSLDINWKYIPAITAFFYCSNSNIKWPTKLGYLLLCASKFYWGKV